MEQNTKKCPYCGEEIMADAKKCRHCGEWLDKTSDASVEKSTVRPIKENKKRTWLYVAVIAIVAVVASVLIVLFSKNGKDHVATEKQAAPPAMDYTIKQVSFDPKSLVALNLMSREGANNILKSSGWENAFTMEENGQIGAEGFVKDFDELNVIYKYVSNTNRLGAGYIEFETKLQSILDDWVKTLSASGYMYSITKQQKEALTSSEVKGREVKGREVTDLLLASNDTVNSPVYGIWLSTFYSDESMTIPIPDSNTATLYVKKLPSNTK